MALAIEPVTTRQQRKLFFDFPWGLYRGDPNWIPPLRQNRKELLNYIKHPFYDTNRIQTFLATESGKPVGTIAAIENRDHIAYQNDARGFWGFFESVDDQNVASGLFDAARGWLGERGLTALRGPANPSLNYECGLLVDGFHRPPTFMMTYNPPYYQRLVEGYGFQKAQDLFAYWGPTSMIRNFDEKLVYITKAAAERFNVLVRPLNKVRFREEIEMFLDLYNQSLGGTWGFVPLSAGEIRHMASSLKHLIIPELAMVAEVDRKPVGAVFAIADYNPRIKAIDGRLFPFGFFKLLAKNPPFERFRVISANVIPEYQRWGVGLVLLRGLIPKIIGSGLKEAEFSWVLESNALSRGGLEKGGALREKTYRLYDYGTPGV